jgi:hypothetical protein
MAFAATPLPPRASTLFQKVEFAKHHARFAAAMVAFPV